MGWMVFVGMMVIALGCFVLAIIPSAPPTPTPSPKVCYSSTPPSQPLMRDDLVARSRYVVPCPNQPG